MMSEWSSGYVTDISYTTGFYREQLPGFFEYLGLVQNMRPPRLDRPFAAAELGCGVGLTAAVMAATHPDARIWAIDFNPAHIAQAEAFRAEADLPNLTYQELSFGEAAARDDYPPLDLITLHGIYSWVSEEVRADIVAFIRKNLKPGGMVYVSYNALPGWARLAPMQKWMAEFAPQVSGNSMAKVKGGIDFLNRMREAGAGYFVVNSGADKHLEGLTGRPTPYLSHEYLNGYWHPRYVTDVMAEMERAKLVYCGSASIVENFDGYCLPQTAQELVRELPNRGLQELARDYFANRNFRRDVYVRGATGMSAAERTQLMGRLRVALTVRPDQVTYKARCAIGEIGFDTPQCRAVVAALADGPKAIGTLRRLPELAAANDGAALSVVNVLMVAGVLVPCGAGDRSAAAAASCARLNAAVMARAKAGEFVPVLASPNAATALSIPATDLVMLSDPWREGKEAVRAAMEARLRGGGQTLTVQGKLVTDPAAISQHIETEIGAFIDQRVPLWRSLGMIA